MAVYEKGNTEVNSGHLSQTEVHLYGSSRLGMYRLSRDVEMPVTNTTGIYAFVRGQKVYELSNHLGNVLVTLSDRKLQLQSSVNPALVEGYVGDVITAVDYFPFGMVMVGRKFIADGAYRYGFNGKENDNEIKGEGNIIDYGLRIYDPGLGRFLSTDPLGKKFPFLTPYQYASNSPIAFVDLDGAEANYASFKMMAEMIEAEAALYKGNIKEMPFRLQSQLFMLGMAKSATIEGLMYEIDKGFQGIFSNLPSINFNELPPTAQQELMQQAIDRNSPLGLVAIVKGLGNTISAAVNGNPEALGNLAGMILAAKMFKMPESELSSTASGQFLQNAKNVAGSADEALRQIGNDVAEFKELERVVVTSSPKYFRGAKSMENPFKMSKADIRNSVDSETGLMKENGVSLNLDKNNKFVQEYGGAWEVDISTIPSELKLKQTKGTHYEITPQKAGTMTLQRYQELLKQVKVKPLNTTE